MVKGSKCACCVLSRYHVAAEIRGDSNEVKWVVVGVYGWREGEHKHQTWELM